MLNRIYVICLLNICFFSHYFFSSLTANEKSDCVNESKKKYNLSICAIFKNEAKYLKEWVEYHRVVGVDHFYLYNIGSSDAFKKVLNPYVNEGIVTLINWPVYVGELNEEEAYKWSLAVQIPAYENVIKGRATHETKWLVFIDVDEFLVSPKTNSLIDILDQYDDFPGVDISCSYFDASKVDGLSKRKLLVQTVALTKAPQINPEKEISKTIFKPDQTQGFTWPPYKTVFKNVNIATRAKKQELRINHYTNRNTGYFFTKIKDKLHIDNRMLSEEETIQLLALDYEIEDQERVMYRFVPELLKRMGYETGWDW